MREFIFLLLLFVLHQSTGGFIDLGEQCVPGNTNYDWDLCNYDYQKLDFDWFNVRISKINSPSNEKPRNISAKIEIPVSRKFIQFVLNENSKFRYLEEADFIELRLEVIGTSSEDFSMKVDPRVVYQSHVQYLPEPWQFKYNIEGQCDTTDLDIELCPNCKFCPKGQIYSNTVEAKFGFLQLYFQPSQYIRNSFSDFTERKKFKIRLGDIEHELLFVQITSHNIGKLKLESLNLNYTNTYTYTKRKITDENGSFSQLRSLTLHESTENITRLSGTQEDGVEISGVIVKDNEWDFHGNVTATHPSFAGGKEVVNFVFKTVECCLGLNRSYHFETTENFLDVRPLKVDFIQTEKRDSLEKLESITFKLNVNLMDLTFVLKSEPRKKVFTVFSTDVIREKASLNSSSGNILYQNINDECKIEDQSSLFRYQLEPEPSTRIPCWDKATFTVEKNGLKQISIKHEYLGYDIKKTFLAIESFIYKTQISFDDVSTIHQRLCGFSTHLCFQNLNFSLVHYNDDKAIKFFPRLTKDDEDLFNLSFGYTYFPFFHFNSSYVIPLFKYLTSFSSSGPLAPFSINFDTENLKNDTNIYLAEIGRNKFWLNHFYLWHEKEDGNVSKLLKFKFLVPHGYRSITGVMLDTSDDYFNHGHMKIGFDTYAYDVKLFLELSSDQFNVKTNLLIKNIKEYYRSFKLEVLNDGKNGTWEIPINIFKYF